MLKCVWEQLGEPALQTKNVTLRGANGQDLGPMGDVQARGPTCKIKVQFKAVVARDARRCLLSGTKLRTNGYTFTQIQQGSFLTLSKGGHKVQMTREGNRDTLKIICFLKPMGTQSVTSLMLKRELESVRRELRNLRTGQHENTRENVECEMTADQRITHERAGHATYDPRCETCVEVRGVSTHPRNAVEEAAYFYFAVVKNSEQGAEVKILVGAGPRGETFARAVRRKGAKFEDLVQFLKVLQTRDGNIPVNCDQKECLRDVVHSAAEPLGMPTGVTAAEQSQANGRAEQRVRALRERLRILVEDARRQGTEIILDHPVAEWAVRHAEWIQNFLGKSDIDLSGGTIKITPHEAHTGDQAPSNVVGFLERVLVRKNQR